MSEVEARPESAPATRPGSFLRRLVDWAEVPDPFGWFETQAALLRVEETTTDHEHVVRVEIPGIDPDEDASVTVEGDLLRITATRREQQSTEEHGVRRSEFRYGSFSRTLPIPAGTDPDGVTASYRDGILEVRIPMPAERPAPTGRILITKA